MAEKRFKTKDKTERAPGLERIRTPHYSSLVVLAVMGTYWYGHMGSIVTEMANTQIVALSKSLSTEEHNDMLFEKWVVFPGMDNETRDVVEAIHRHQHPEDCSKVKYFVYYPGNKGLGCDLRWNAWLLFAGYLQDRVVVFPPAYRTEKDKWVWADESYCAESTLNPDCYFEPYSGCQDYVNSMVTKEMMEKAGETSDIYNEWSSGNDTFVYLNFMAWWLAKWATPLPSELPHSEGKDYRLWLWPIQIRYTTRILPRTADWVKEYLKTALYKYTSGDDVPVLVYPQEPPAQAICMHIRHGDKAEEMPLHPLSEYLDAAKEYQRKLNVSNIFITTEDPVVIDEMLSANTSSHYHFTYYFTQYKRIGGSDSPMAAARQLGGSYLTLVSLANLYLGVHPNCVAFVETICSNWCALIDDTRLTDGKRKNAYMTDFEKTQYY